MSEQAAVYLEQPELVIVRGLPGVGKSMLARERFPGYMLWEPDAFVTDGHGRYRFDLQYWPEAQRWCRMMADFSLARGENTVVADVFCTWDDFSWYIRLAKAHGARARVVTILGEGATGVHHVPLKILAGMRDEFNCSPCPGPVSMSNLFVHEIVDTRT